MIKEGEGRYTEWKKKIQSLSYIFKEETCMIFLQTERLMKYLIARKDIHLFSEIILSGKTSLETLVICDRII